MYVCEHVPLRCRPSLLDAAHQLLLAERAHVFLDVEETREILGGHVLAYPLETVVSVYAHNARVLVRAQCIECRRRASTSKEIQDVVSSDSSAM